MTETRKNDTPSRIFVNATCSECRSNYTMAVLPGWSWETHGYCAPACARRAARRRKAMRHCPTARCENEILKPGAVNCGSCWSLVANMCKGKRRFTEPAARRIELARGLAACWCRCCGWWHNTGHPVEDEAGLLKKAGLVLEGMRQSRGQVWVNDLIESWDPAVSDRQAWQSARNVKDQG